MKINRTDRLNSEFKKEIYEIISKKLKNPLITEMFSVTDVDTSKDLKNARVYISVYSKDEAKKKATFEAIKSEAGRIRKELAKTSRIRTVPEIRILADNSMEYGDRIDKLLNSLNITPEKEDKEDKEEN